MVVLAILGLLTGTVALSLPPGEPDLVDEAARLAARIERAGEESIVSGERLGLRVDPGQYSFWYQRRGQWLPLSRDRFYAPQPWQPGTRAAFLEIDAWFDLEDRGDRGDRRATPPPVRFDPAGMQTPFTLHLARNGNDLYVIGTATGRVQIARTPLAELD